MFCVLCSLQQGYECTRRFLTELISSPSSDDGLQLELENCHENCRTAAGKAHDARNDVPSSLNQTLRDVRRTELGTVSTSYTELSNAPAFVDCVPADDNVLPWCTASQHEMFGGLDSSFSEASVLETQV